jgi:hypothetical protein
MSDRELPPKARAKIFNLADREAAALVAMNSNLRTIAEIAKAHDISSDEGGKRELKKEVDHRQLVQETNRDRHRALADLNAKIRRFLDLLPADCVLEDAKPVKVKLKAGETHQQLVADLRVKIVQLIGERSQVERAGLPPDEIKAQVKKWIVERGMHARPTLVANHSEFKIRFDVMDHDSFAPTLDVLALLAFFDAEHLETRLFELVDAMPKAKFVMTPAEKSERLRALKDELDVAERLEVAIVDDALDNAVMIDHRPNVDIRALLGLVVTKKNKKAA